MAPGLRIGANCWNQHTDWQHNAQRPCSCGFLLAGHQFAIETDCQMSLQPARAGTVDVGSVDRDAWSRVAAGIGLSARMRLVREAVAALHDGLDHARFGQGCTQPRDRHFDGVLVLTMPI
jgi:hypothetical protein